MAKSVARVLAFLQDLSWEQICPVGYEPQNKPGKHTRLEAFCLQREPSVYSVYRNNNTDSASCYYLRQYGAWGKHFACILCDSDGPSCHGCKYIQIPERGGTRCVIHFLLAPTFFLFFTHFSAHCPSKSV